MVALEALSNSSKRMIKPMMNELHASPMIVMSVLQDFSDRYICKAFSARWDWDMTSSPLYPCDDRCKRVLLYFD